MQVPGDVLDFYQSGDTAVVDLEEGEIVIDPTPVEALLGEDKA